LDSFAVSYPLDNGKEAIEWNDIMEARLFIDF